MDWQVHYHYKIRFTETSLVGSAQKSRSSRYEYVAILLAAYPYQYDANLTTFHTILVISNIFKKHYDDLLVTCSAHFDENFASKYLL